jgi:hypothetical protein
MKCSVANRSHQARCINATYMHGTVLFAEPRKGWLDFTFYVRLTWCVNSYQHCQFRIQIYFYVEPRSVLDRPWAAQRAVQDHRLIPRVSRTRPVPLRAVVDTRIARLFSCHHIDGSGAANQHLVPAGRAVCSATARRNYA